MTTPKIDSLIKERVTRTLKTHAEGLRKQFVQFCKEIDGIEDWELLGKIQAIRRCYERFQHESQLLECCDNDDDATYRELNDNRLKQLGISD